MDNIINDLLLFKTIKNHGNNSYKSIKDAGVSKIMQLNSKLT
jgi:hypothetical protein